ncbi:MAG: sulfur carrier protein ThiS adenylyltransferase ThiF [Elusimicrobiota bacterium]
MKKDINEIFRIYFSSRELKKISKAKIMVIGCGGLGSNILNILVRTGFKNFVIVDYDMVELKNLNRQFYFPEDVGKNKVEITKKRLLKINPEANIIAINKMLNQKLLSKIIKDYNPDIVVEAVDKEWAKKMVFETSLKLKKVVIMASGVAGYGDIENVKIIRKKEYTIIGDLISRCGCCDECYQEKGCNSRDKLIKEGECHIPLAPKVIAVASMQADEVLRRVLQNQIPEDR